MDLFAVFDLRQERRESLLDDVFDDVIGCVVGAGGFALRSVGLESEPAVLRDEVMFEQSFVDRPKLLNAQVAEVNRLHR